MFFSSYADSSYRILATGSRGKSSLVRLLHCALNHCGIPAYARITGVVPRELDPFGEKIICRSAGAHVEEMRWWLKQLPGAKNGIVLENSAIAEELQPLAGRWLKPQVTVLANILPDHQEVWGPTSDCAATTLVAGIPERCPVVIPHQLKDDAFLNRLLKAKGCPVVVAATDQCVSGDFHEYNIQLALAALKYVGLDETQALAGLRTLAADRFDFHVEKHHGVEIALAFTANDVTSTAALFKSLRWDAEDTLLMFNHRADRIGRLQSFAGWLNGTKWRDVLVTGDKPGRYLSSGKFLNVKQPEALLEFFKPGDKIFGCGNVAGLPMQLVAATAV